MLAPPPVAARPTGDARSDSHNNHSHSVMMIMRERESYLLRAEKQPADQRAAKLGLPRDNCPPLSQFPRARPGLAHFVPRNSELSELFCVHCSTLAGWQRPANIAGRLAAILLRHALPETQANSRRRRRRWRRMRATRSK